MAEATATAEAIKEGTDIKWEGADIEVNFVIAHDGEALITLAINDSKWIFPTDAAFRLADALSSQATEGERYARSPQQEVQTR